MIAWPALERAAQQAGWKRNRLGGSATGAPGAARRAVSVVRRRDAGYRVGGAWHNRRVRRGVQRGVQRARDRAGLHILKAMKRSPLGLDLYLWLTYLTFTRCVDIEAYQETDEYRETMERRASLKPADVLAAVDAEGGYFAKAARRLGVLKLGPRGDSTGEWLRRWSKSRAILPAVYEIRRKHGWGGPRNRPRKHPAPVLVFSQQAAGE